VLEQEAAHPGARAAWSEVHARVRDGSSLADALAAQGALFAPVFIAMVRAGAAAGFVAEVLGQIADYLERSRELGGRVLTALVYPCLLAVIAGGVVCFLLVWFIPRFATLFASFHQELPLLTQGIQALSVALTRHGWLVALALGGAALGVHQALQRPWGAALADRLLLRLPGIGAVRSGLARTRFCRMLGTLLRAGVPLLPALTVARATVGSRELEQALVEAGERIRQGGTLTAALAALSGSVSLLPPAARESLGVAEAARRLAEELLRQADAGERDLDRRLRTLVALAEPLLLLLMAALVGTIVVGMLLPIFDLWSAIK
jgi:type II secretory pathway component PulF